MQMRASALQNLSMNPAGIQARVNMDSAWWDRFLEQTNNMAAPNVFKGAIGSELAVTMRRYVLDIIAELARKWKATYGYRLWLDGERVTDLDAHFDLPPTPGETLEEWVQRVFGSRKFGII